MEIILKELLEKDDKIISCDEKFLINEIKLVDDLDQIILDLQQKNLIYENVIMTKGFIFPIPKVNQIISVKKISLKYDQEFELKLFIEGNIDKNSGKPKIMEVKKNFSFNSQNILKTISELTNIPIPVINSTIFKIERILDDRTANIFSILDSNIYSIELKGNQLDKYNSNDFIWICNYEVEQNKIKLNKMTTLEKLDDEKLINYLDRAKMKKNILFEVIDIDEENIVLVNDKIFKINKNNEVIKNKNIYSCSTIIISNYTVKNNNEIEIIDKSFIYQFKREFYYIENILINLISVLELHFLDYNKDYNKFDCISCDLFKNDKIISKEIEYIIFDSVTSKKYEFYPINLTLSNSKNKNLKITFSFYLYPALLNKINVFLNTQKEKTYFFEYLFYNLTDDLEDVTKEIIVDDKQYHITCYDSFGSKNRKRISIMNIPFQKMEVSENEKLNGNSFQICELIQNDIHKIIGIYDIFYEFKDSENQNNCFDKYFEDFGDIYDKMKLSYSLELENIMTALKNKMKEYNEIKFVDDLTDTNNFSKLMTLSQFKTWFGLIICKYVNKYKDNDNYIKKIIKEVHIMLDDIINENLKYNDIIRILIFTLKEKIDKKSNIELIFISKLNKNSPFALAYKFNKCQIQEMNEFSALFQAYLQLDSYVAFNYIHTKQTHTFSLELNFMVKYQLLSTYDDFVFVKREKSDEYALIDYETKITVINITRSFGENFDVYDEINDLNIAKNYAFPLSLHFMHEKSGHYKYSLKNKGFECPCIYYRGLKIEFEVSHFYKEKKVYGESGIIIENFICKDKFIIHELSSNFIFGEFLEKEYFNGKDFTKLINAVTLKLNKCQSVNDKQKSSSNRINADKIEKFNESQELLNLSPFIKVGDVELNINRIEKNINMSKEEKQKIDKQNLLDKINKIKNLKKKKGY